MKDSSFDRHRKVKFTLNVLAVGLIVSTLVGIVLVLINRTPRSF